MLAESSLRTSSHKPHSQRNVSIKTDYSESEKILGAQTAGDESARHHQNNTVISTSNFRTQHTHHDSVFMCLERLPD